MGQNSRCVQFYVNGAKPSSMQNMSSDVIRPFVLHLDEVDVMAMKWERRSCSICEKSTNCDRLVSKAKLFFANAEVVTLGGR